MNENKEFEEIELKKIIKNVYKSIVFIKPPERGINFMKNLYEKIINNGRTNGFDVKDQQPFHPIKYEKNGILCSQIEIQFGSKRDVHRTMKSLATSGAIVGVYITSSKSRGGYSMFQIANMLSHTEDKTSRFIVYDIETGNHIVVGIDPVYNKKLLYHPVNLFGGPMKYMKGYAKKRRKRVYGKTLT